MVAGVTLGEDGAPGSAPRGEGGILDVTGVDTFPTKGDCALPKGLRLGRSQTQDSCVSEPKSGPYKGDQIEAGSYPEHPGPGAAGSMGFDGRTGSQEAHPVRVFPKGLSQWTKMWDKTEGPESHSLQR